MKPKISLWHMVLAGVLAALVFAGNFARITLPISVGGTTAFTLGNIMCVLSGLLLGPLGGLSAGIGSALYDLTNPLYINEVPFTFINKLLMGLVAGLIARWHGTEKGGYPRCLIAALLGCTAYYIPFFLKTYFYNGMLLQGLSSQVAWVAVLEKIPAALFNGTIAIVAAPPLALAIRKALKSGGMRSI